LQIFPSRKPIDVEGGDYEERVESRNNPSAYLRAGLCDNFSWGLRGEKVLCFLLTMVYFSKLENVDREKRGTNGSQGVPKSAARRTRYAKGRGGGSGCFWSFWGEWLERGQKPRGGNRGFFGRSSSIACGEGDVGTKTVRLWLKMPFKDGKMEKDTGVRRSISAKVDFLHDVVRKSVEAYGGKEEEHGGTLENCGVFSTPKNKNPQTTTPPKTPKVLTNHLLKLFIYLRGLVESPPFRKMDSRVPGRSSLILRRVRVGCGVGGGIRNCISTM